MTSERLKQWLRGEHNSIVYRFWLRPWRWLRFWMPIAIFGGSELPVWAKLTDESILPRVRTMPSEHYMAHGQFLFEYAMSLGIQPTDRLLDYGCGPMRVGVHFARTLRPGNYVGADTSRSMLRRGEFVMTQLGIPRKDYHAVHISSVTLEELEYFTFDWIVAYSSLQYLSNTDFQATLYAFRRLISNTGRIMVSVPSELERGEVRRKRHHFREPEVLEHMCRNAGFEMDYFENRDPNRAPLGAYIRLQVAEARPQPQAIGSSV